MGSIRVLYYRSLIIRIGFGGVNCARYTWRILGRVK